MNEALRKHIDETEQFVLFKDLASDLTDATNIMGCDSYVASQIAQTLKESDPQDRFFLLLDDAIPALLHKISPHDGRVEASYKLLNEIQEPLHKPVFPKNAVDGFVEGIARSHSTLIQSFFRAMKSAASDIAGGNVSTSAETDIASFNKAKLDIRVALKILLELLSTFDLDSDTKSTLVKRLDESNVYLPFI